MAIKYYADSVTGKNLGSFDGALPPDGAVEVATMAPDGRSVLVNGEWTLPPELLVKIEEQAKIDEARVALTKEGLSLEDKVNALWERVVNGKASATDAIQAIIDKPAIP